jgi:hypothetical protein
MLGVTLGSFLVVESNSAEDIGTRKTSLSVIEYEGWLVFVRGGYAVEGVVGCGHLMLEVSYERHPFGSWSRRETLD